MATACVVLQFLICLDDIVHTKLPGVCLQQEGEALLH